MKNTKDKIIISIAIVMFIFGCTLMGISLYNKLGNNDDQNTEESNNSNNKSKETDADKITDFIKNNMISNWAYTRDKLTVNEDNSVEILFNAVDDWTTCGYNANKSVVKITGNGDDILNKIPSITFVCKDSNSNVVSKASYTNISSINKDNVESNAVFYDSNNNQINSSVESGYQSTCKNYSYKEIFRNPDDYLYKKIKITGEVIQVMEDDNYVSIRLAVGGGSNVLYVVIPSSILNNERILEDDYITVYGTSTGVITYTTVMGNELTIPSMLAAKLDR